MSNKKLQRVKREFHQWRSQRKSRRAVTPLRLRRLALSLCKKHGQERVCEELGISSGSLWQWSRDYSWSCKIAKKRAIKESAQKIPEFVELTPKVAAEDPAVPIGIEWQRADGASMKITGVGMRDAAALVADFLRMEQPIRPRGQL